MLQSVLLSTIVIVFDRHPAAQPSVAAAAAAHPASHRAISCIRVQVPCNNSSCALLRSLACAVVAFSSVMSGDLFSIYKGVNWFDILAR